MRIGDLARHMIVTSSNLATNLLVDLIKVDQAQQMLARHGIRGIELARGVEDDKAFDANFNNRVTANGLVALFRVIHDRSASSAVVPGGRSLSARLKSSYATSNFWKTASSLAEK